jgi:hydrogenase nickel incorporation protein HypB
LVCPSSYDLGENLRLVLLSVTEGEDKLLKYPTIFNTADVAVITKMNLADAVEFNEESVTANIQAVRPECVTSLFQQKLVPVLGSIYNFLRSGSLNSRRRCLYKNRWAMVASMTYFSHLTSKMDTYKPLVV